MARKLAERGLSAAQLSAHDPLMSAVPRRNIPSRFTPLDGLQVEYSE
ncbi:hypothetical protein KKC97_03645 [bacterium]|nr:hypothetical protein [bacterium]MBU1636737.1 hypothetical protein [bacterium]